MEPFERGEKVRIYDGVFRNFTGVVTDVYVERRKLGVTVTLFSRSIAMELDFTQVQRVA